MVPIPATSAGGNVQRKILTVGYAHWLSKRTEPYALVVRDSTRSNIDGAGIVNPKGKGYAVDVRHTF